MDEGQAIFASIIMVSILQVNKEISERSANLSRVSQLTIWGQLSSLSLADRDPVFLPIHLSSLPSLLSSTFSLPSFTVSLPSSLLPVFPSSNPLSRDSHIHSLICLSSSPSSEESKAGEWHHHLFKATEPPGCLHLHLQGLTPFVLNSWERR